MEIHAGSVKNPDKEATQSNPLCGDRVIIQLNMDGDRIKDLWYRVRGCILCKASCALMAHLVRGADQSGLKALKNHFEGFLKSSSDVVTETAADYEMFFPVRSCKSRHRCVLLPYETALRAFGG